MRTSSRPGRRVAALGAALTLALALGACGGDDDAADDTTTTTAATTTEAETTTTTEGDEPTTTTEAEDERPDDEEAEALAEAINLTLDDFAEGWTEEPADDDEGDDELNACFTEIDLDEVTVAEADSPTFQIGSEDGSQGQVVQTTTIVFADDETAESVMAEIPTNQFAGCAEDALVASVEEDNELIDSGLDPVEDTGGLGDEAAGLAGSISFTNDGTEYSGQLAYYFIRTGNVVSGISLLDIGDVAFEDTLTGLLETVATRQASEIG